MKLRWLVPLTLFLVAMPATAVLCAEPDNAQVDIATLKAQVAAQNDRADLEKRLAALEGKTAAEDLARDNLGHEITIFGILLTLIGLATGVASYFVAGARAAKQAHDEMAGAKKDIETLRDEAAKATEQAQQATMGAAAAATQAAEAEKKAKKALKQAEIAAASAQGHRDSAAASAQVTADKQREAAEIVESVKASAAGTSPVALTQDQERKIVSAAEESKSVAEANWSIDQFKTAIGKAMYIDKNWKEARRLAVKMESIWASDAGARLYALNRRGDVERELASFEEALGAYEAVVAMTTDDPSETQIEDYMWSKHHMAICLNALGRSGEAEKVFAILLPLCKKVFGPDGGNTFIARHEHARAVLNQGRAAEAENLFADLLSHGAMIDGDEAPSTLITRHEHARAILDQGRAAEAEKLYETLIPLCEKVDGANTSGTLLTRHVHARAILDQGRPDEAAKFFSDLLPLSEKVDGPEASSTLMLRFSYALATLLTGDVRLASNIIARIPDPICSSGWQPRYAAFAAYVRGRIADANGNRDDADALLGQAQTILVEILPAGHPVRSELDAYLATRQGRNGNA